MTGNIAHLAGKWNGIGGRGFKSNFRDAATGEYYWISGCRKDGRDGLYTTDVEIDEDVREEYWRDIRHHPESTNVSKFRAEGKCR